MVARLNHFLNDHTYSVSSVRANRPKLNYFPASAEEKLCTDLFLLHPIDEDEHEESNSPLGEMKESSQASGLPEGTFMHQPYY